jgi:capsular exopolysaccharide synthesis family protein
MQVSSVATGYEAQLGDVIRNVKDVLRRRYLILGAVAVAVTLLGVALTFAITPRYQGVARIQIDPSRDPLAREHNSGQADLASEAIETHVTALTSLDLARAVVARLNLMSDPNFKKDVDRAMAQHALSKDQQIDVVANDLEEHLTVSREKLTYIITIKYSSTDPKMAARVANEFAAAYLDSMVNNNIGTAQKQATFFQGQLNQMASDARVADTKVAEFEAKAGVMAKSDVVGTITDQQIGPLSVTLSSAEGLAAEARAKATSARELVARGKLETVADVRQSATIIDLKSKRALLLQDLADMQQRYGNAYPDLIKVRGQIKAIDQQLSIEADRVIASLDSEALAAEAQAASLRGSMEGLRNKKATEVEASVMLQSLQRDADSKHAAYDRMAQTTMDSRQASQASFAQAQIVDPARVPETPYFPKLPIMIAVSLVAGIALGVLVISIQEILISGLTSVQDIEGDLGLKLIAAIPLVRNTARPADLLTTKPTSQYAEALRNARATILGVKGENEYKIIALTSALPNEGKTTTALALARTMAINGGRTLIVDADVRRAQLNSLLLTQTPGVGLVEVLSGVATLESAIRSTDIPRLDVIGVSKPHFTSDNLFGTDQFQSILDELSERYETIILDLPPLVGLADGRFLAALADAVVLVVKWNDTPASAVKSAVNWLQSDNANLVGAMYSMVEPNSQTYGSYYYYSSAYSKYYQET